MLSTLLESRPRRHRPDSASAVSFFAHALLITIAVYLTGAVDPAPRATVIADPPIYHIPVSAPTTPAPATTASAATPSPAPPPLLPTVPFPTIVPVGIPAPTLTALTPAAIGDPGRAVPGVSSGPATGTGGPGDGSPFTGMTVDRQAQLLRGSATPRYPDPLRRDRIEGAVRTMYVVDTLGRVELASFQVLDSSHPLFERAVRDALAAMRFAPAEAGGQRVRQLVEQSFVFALRR